VKSRSFILKASFEQNQEELLGDFFTFLSLFWSYDVKCAEYSLF
jgi:hypothetical protein